MTIDISHSIKYACKFMNYDKKQNFGGYLINLIHHPIILKIGFETR